MAEQARVPVDQDDQGASTSAAEAEVEALGEQVEADLDELTTVAAERDEYLALAQRIQAEFENYKRRASKELQEAGARGASQLAGGLLDVLDACDAALIHGVDGVGPIYKALMDALTKQGLEVIVADDQPFDPNLHEAVMHEPAEEAGAAPVVTEALRTGYLWKGRVLRPAMVKVRG